MVIVCPATTDEVSLRPFAAASARVVKLFAAAIDHSVSPGWTTCGTPAEAGVAVITHARRATRQPRDTSPMHNRFPDRHEGDSRYRRMHACVHSRICYEC